MEIHVENFVFIVFFRHLLFMVFSVHCSPKNLFKRIEAKTRHCDVN